MLERLVQLIIRLKQVLLRIEEREQDSHGNEAEIEALKLELGGLQADQAAAMKALDDLEEVIKKWES